MIIFVDFADLIQEVKNLNLRLKWPRWIAILLVCRRFLEVKDVRGRGIPRVIVLVVSLSWCVNARGG